MYAPNLIRRFLIVVAVMALSGGPSAMAVDPNGNDAGTGADAGDAVQLATPISEGAHTGAITPPSDRLDYYLIDARKGEAITATFASGGAARMTLLSPAAVGVPLELTPVPFGQPISEGKTNLMLIPFDGVWTLRVHPHVENRFERLPYSFSFSLDDPATAAILDDATAWKVLEADLSEGQNFHMIARVPRPSAFFDAPSIHSTTKAYFAFAMIETWTPEDGAKPSAAIIFDGRGIGDDVVVSPAGVSATLPVHIEFDRGFGTLLLTSSGPFQGKIRLTIVHSHDAPQTSLSFVSDQEIDLRTATGQGTVAWTEGAADGDPQVRAPGVSVIGPQSYALDVQGRFAGYFRPGSGAGAPGYTIEDPKGAQLSINPGCSCLSLHDPIPGTWKFTLGQSIGYGERARHTWLGGAFVPRLGIFPEPVA